MMEPRYVHVRCCTERGVLVLTITQPLLLDDDIADVLRQDFIAAIEYHKPAAVVVCCSRVRAVSSTAFRPLISLQRRVQAGNGRLVLCSLTGMPAEVFRITGLIGDNDAPFETEADVPTALTRLTQH